MIKYFSEFCINLYKWLRPSNSKGLAHCALHCRWFLAFLPLTPLIIDHTFYTSTSHCHTSHPSHNHVATMRCISSSLKGKVTIESEAQIGASLHSMLPCCLWQNKIGENRNIFKRTAPEFPTTCHLR